MATEDEAREAADGTEVQVEAVDLGTVHLQAHPEVKLSSLMEIKNVGEIIDSTEGTLKIPEDQVLVEAPSDVQLPPEHNLNGEASSLNGYTDREDKVSNEQPHDGDQEEAELDQSNGINKEDVTDGLSHGESTTEDSCLLKHKKDEEPKGDGQQDLGVTVDDDSVQEDMLKTDNAIEQTDDGQQDRNQEPEKENENTEPASITNNADVDIVAEAATGLQAPVEKRMNDSDDIPETIDEKTEIDEPAEADGVVHPEGVAKVEDQQSQQADMMDSDVVLEEIKCEETYQQEEKPKSEAHEPTIDAQGVLNQESAEETDDPMNEKIEETARDVAAPKETTLEHEATISALPVNTQVQSQESLEETEDTEAEIQPSSGFGDAYPEDQSNLGVTIDNDTVNEDTLRGIEKQDDGQQDEDLEPEKATENTQPASMTNIPHVEIVTGEPSGVQTPGEPNLDNSDAVPDTIDANTETDEPAKAHAVVHLDKKGEAPSGVQTPGEPNLDNSDAVPDTIDANIETDDPAKAHAVVHLDKKESFPEDTSTPEPTEEVVKVDDQESQKADEMDANMVQEEVPKSEHADEPATDALEVLNQESAEEIDAPVNTEETAHQSNMPASVETTPEYDVTSEPPVNIQAQNQESLKESEATVEEREHTVQEGTLEATGQTKDGQQNQDLVLENATENTQPASIANIPDVEVITEASSGIQTPVEINLDTFDAIPDTTNGNTETDEPAKANTVVHPDKKKSFPEDTSTTEPTEEMVKLEDQHNQQADALDEEVVQEEEPKSEHTDEPATDAVEALNPESAEETDGPVDENTEETAHQSNMPASEETTPKYDTATWELPVTIQAQNLESLEEREVVEAVDTEAIVQQSSVAFEEAVPEDQHNLGATNTTVQEDTLKATGQTKEDQQYQDLGPESATETTEPESTADIPDVEVITEAPSGIQTPVEINLDISDAIPDTIDGNTETDEPSKAHVVVHLDKKESFPEDTSTAGPTEEVAKLEDQRSEQADAMDANVVQEDVPESEHANEPATDALEVLNQESAEETDGPVNENTEETAHQSNMPACEETTQEYDATTREPPVTIQAQNLESLEETEATVEEREVAEAVATEAPVQQSSVAFEDAVPEDQHDLGATNNTLQEDTEEAIGQTKDGQQYNLGSENATVNTQPESMENIPDVEVITEAPSGIQTPVEINLDISDAIPDTTDGNTEADELVEPEGVIHAEMKESFPEDTSTAEPTEEVAKVDQQSQQADAMVADVVQEEVPKSEHDDEPGVSAQGVLNQESAEETDGLMNVNTEETEHKSNMVVPEDTMPEHDAQMGGPPVNIQEQSQESVGDAEAVDTEAKMQQSSVAFEETTPENHVAITESCSEIQHVHHMEPEEINGPGDPRDDESTNMSNTENLLQDNILPSGPTIDIQPVQELEQIEMDEASNQTHAVVFNDLAQEDATKTSEPQVIEKEELKDIEATEAEEITKLDHVTPSKDLAVENDSTVDEPHNGEIHQTSEQDLVEVKDTETYHEKTISTSEDTVEDNVTADEPSCGSQEVVNAESTEETKQNTAENIAEVPDVIIDDEAIEQDVLETDDVTEMRERELEPEEMKSTEPVESEEAYDLRNDALFDNSAQEDNIHESEMEQTESVTEIKEIEPTEVEAVPRESNACVSDELSQDYIKESETSCDNQQVNITESSEVIDGHKDIITGGISGQRNTASAGDSAEESSVPEGEPPADIQAVQELGSEEIKNTQIDEVNEPSLEMDATVIQTPTQEENPATTELHESTEVSNIEAIEVHRNPHESDAAAQSEEQATEEIASGLKPESIEDNDTEANEPQSTSQEKIIYTSEDSVPEEIATEDNIITEPDVDHQQLHDQESAEIKGTEADKSQEIAPSNTLSSEESTSEDNVTSTEPSSDTQAENSQLAEETEDSENVKSNTALAEAAAPETDATADTSSFHEADLEETKDTGPIETEDVMTSSDYTSEKMGMETMETEAVPDESNVAKEHIEDNTSTPNAPHDGTEPVCELESVEDRTDTTEHPRETHGSTSDELTPTEEDTTVTEPSFNTQEVQNLTSQEMKDSEDDKTDEFSDISSFPTPGEVDQVPRTRIGPTPDVQEMQELGLTEESRDIEAMEPEDHQEHIVSTLEKPAVDGEPNADDQQVHEDKVPEVEDNKTIEADEDSKQSNIATPDNAAEERNELGLTEESRDVEAMEPEDHQERIVSTLEKPAVDGEPNANDQEVHEDKVPEVEDNKAIEADEDSKKSNIATPDNAAEERNELESDLDSYAQPTQQVELSKDNENSQLVKEVETSGQSNSVTLEERTTEYSVTSETDPPVDIKQEPPVEEIKSVDATEAEEDFHTSGSDAIKKLASESNIATIEPTYNIQQVDVLEATKEKKNAEAINDGEQSNIAVSEEPTITDNGATPKDHHVESNEGTIGNETDNVILAHGIKDEIQKSAQLKDDACDLGETVLTTQRSENKTDEDAVTSGNDLETSNNIHQVKEEPNAGTEHNSSQMSSERNGENTTHVKDRDVEGQVLTESDTAEASQALFENDPQAAQDTTQKDDITKGSEQTSDHDSKQHGDVALQQQSCETDVLSIEKQDEALQKIDSDQKEKEDEEIESQNDELQVGEQKHEDKRDDLTTEPLVEYQNFENAATNRTEDNDAFEVEQTEAAISVILKNEKALHISKKTSEGTEEDDAKNYNKDEKETAENDDIVAKSSTNERSETTDEIRNEELKSGLASSVQEASDPAPSKDKILKNDPVHVVQASEKEITDEIEESKEIHDDNAICHDELQTNSEKEESPQLRSNEQYNVDAKIDDTTPLCEEKVHENASIKPREIKDRGENEGLDSTSEPSIESSIQNNVEDSSSHHKVEDEKLSVSEKNDVDTEVMEEKNDESATDINQTEQCQEEINADDVLQLETEKYSVDKIEETASHEETKTSSTAAIEAVMINEDITDKVTGADGAPSNESFKTFTDTGRDLDVSLVITTSKEDRVNDNMENLNLDHPGHPAQDGNTHEKVLSLEETEREMPSSEKLLQTESGENQIPNEQDEKDIQDEHQTPKEKNEEDMQDTEIGEAKKEVEQELPVSHFLMNLILGKESSDANEDSESEAARKQGEATEDGSCTFISKQEESLGSLPTEDKVDDNLTFVEQEKHEVKCSEETQEMVKEQIDDLKLDTERSIETDEDIKKNTHNLEIPAYQDNPQDEISGELLTGEAADVSTKMETRDINISSVELDDRAVGTVCQENMEVSIKNENGSLRSSLNDSTNTKAPEEDTLGEGQTGLVLESLPEDISFDAVSKQAPLLTESGMTDANDWSRDTAGVQNPVSAKQDKPTESANVEATCSTDIQLENEEVDKKEEEQHANTDIDEVSEENVESSHVNLQKITSSEVTSSELATQITEPVCDTQTILAHEKEISEENFPTAYEIQADGPSLQIDQAKQDEAADNESAMEPEKLVESNFQEHQEIGIEQKSPEETDEGDQQLLAKKEILTQEQDVHETVESPQQAFESPQKTVSIKSNEDQELFDSKFQECDLNVVSPREASEAEENFVEVTKPEFSTDEEQSPKAADAEEKIHDEKIKDIEGTKNFTDEAAVKTEAPGAAQKAHKKQGLLSGVGSKVKHQLAKVKKAIVGKPGRTKPESPKA